MIVKSFREGSFNLSWQLYCALCGMLGWDPVVYIQGLDLATGHPQYLLTSGHNEYLMNIYNLNTTSCF